VFAHEYARNGDVHGGVFLCLKIFARLSSSSPVTAERIIRLPVRAADILVIDPDLTLCPWKKCLKNEESVTRRGYERRKANLQLTILATVQDGRQSPIVRTK